MSPPYDAVVKQCYLAAIFVYFGGRDSHRRHFFHTVGKWLMARLAGFSEGSLTRFRFMSSPPNFLWEDLKPLETGVICGAAMCKSPGVPPQKERQKKGHIQGLF